MAQDKYDQAVLKAASGGTLSRNEQHAFDIAAAEDGTDRGNEARRLRDGK